MSDTRTQAEIDRDNAILMQRHAEAGRRRAWAVAKDMMSRVSDGDLMAPNKKRR